MNELIEWADINNISEDQMPRDKERLLALTKLDLINNQLTTFPDSLGQLTALTELDLSDNPLTDLPESIKQLTKLEVLNRFYRRMP
jgi:internalin A